VLFWIGLHDGIIAVGAKSSAMTELIICLLLSSAFFFFFFSFADIGKTVIQELKDNIVNI
jgi:hypothetical protein